MPKVAMEELISFDYWINLEVIWNKKTHNFTNPQLVQHKTHLQTKITLTHNANMQNKQHKWK